MLNFLIASVQVNPIDMVRAGGYLGIALLIFAESGVLIGIFFPGDSILFAAGLLAASGFFLIGPLILIVVVAAIIGDSVGYWFGLKAGSALFKRADSRFFKQEYLERTKRFYALYGGRAIVLARFVPIVRTIAPILAGTSSMKYRAFLLYNILGGLLWGGGMLLLGYFLGSVIPNSDKYVLPLSLLIVIISFFPILINLVRHKRGF